MKGSAAREGLAAARSPATGGPHGMRLLVAVLAFVRSAACSGGSERAPGPDSRSDSGADPRSYAGTGADAGSRAGTAGPGSPPDTGP